jgi:hypothetical protein
MVPNILQILKVTKPKGGGDFYKTADLATARNKAF